MIIRLAIFVLLGGVFFLPGKIFSQDMKADLDKINQTYASLNSLYTELSYNLYSSFEATEPVSIEKGKFKQTRNASYSIMGAVETYITNQHTLMINHNEKVMLLYPPVPIQFTPNSQIGLDTLLQLCSKLETREIDADTRSHALFMNFYRYQKVEIIFNTETYLLEKIILFLAEPEDLLEESDPILGRMEIVYTNQKVNPSLTTSDFPIHRYIWESKDRMIPTATYSTYQFINQQPIN